ncbi:MAG: transketolase, partial [Rectinemataceae bacterium]|nr:transketolase [Rectinemataceae bacterium]
GWETFEIDGHDMAAVVSALRKAAEGKGKPTCIVARTVKGKGVSFMENKRDWHGKAPNEAQHAQAVAELGGGRK